jgi:hypothetical protein
VGWSWAMTRVPWKTILLHAPTIVDAARSFYGTPRKPADDAGPDDRARGGIESLRQRVEILEQRDAQAAALFEDLARQVQEMVTALEVLRARVQLAVVGASVAILLSGLTSAVLLWRGR